MPYRTQVAHTQLAARLCVVAVATLGLAACGNDPVQVRTAPSVLSATVVNASYRVVQLEPLPGDVSSAARAVNQRGQAVGVSVAGDGASHAVLWSLGEVRDLGSLGGTTSAANAINDRGDVVGVSTTGTGVRRAFLWQRGIMTDLGTLPGGTDSEANGVNARGQVVGVSDSFHGLRGFLWQNGTMIELGPLPGGRKSRAYAINVEGVVVGEGEPELLETHGVLWRAGRAYDLGTMARTKQDFATAHAINARGQIVGVEASGPPRFGVRAFLWERGQFTDLTVIAKMEATAFGINDRGDVVGSSVSPSALLWRNGAAFTLDAPSGFVSSSAAAINATGVVVGAGTDGAGASHGLAWIPLR